MYFFYFLLSGKQIWVRVGGKWLSKTISKYIVEITKFQGSLLKTNQ